MASAVDTDAFENAKNNFLLKYPHGTTYDFTSLPTIDHVYHAAEQIQEQQSTTNATRNLRKIQPFLECLRHYGEVVETFVQVKPDILALIWVKQNSIFNRQMTGLILMLTLLNIQGPIKCVLLVRHPSHSVVKSRRSYTNAEFR